MASYRDKLPSTGGGAVIKSVQRGLSTLSGVVSLSVTINPVNMSRSVLFISISAGTGQSTDSPSSAVCSARLNSETSIFIYRKISSPQPVFVSWEVVEYESGVSVQRGIISSSGTIFSAPISAIDTSKSYSTCTSSPSGLSDTAMQAQVYGGVSSSTELKFNRKTDFGSISIDWQVVSYV